MTELTKKQIGGLKSAHTLRKRYGSDYYARLGARGGNAVRKRFGGFGSNVLGKDNLTGEQRSVIAGRKGGIARARKNKLDNNVA